MITNTITGVSTMEAKQRTILQQGERIGPDPEVPEKPTRRRFTAEYKLRILHLADLRTGEEHIMDFYLTLKNGTVEARLVARRFWEFWK